MVHRLSSRTPEAPLKLFLLAAIVIGLVLRFVHLGRQSLWVDEMITIKNSFIGQTMTASDFFSNLQGPVISLMIHLLGSFGPSEALLRLPFAIAGGLTVVAVFLLAKYLMGSWAALHTALFASLSPILIWYSQEVRGYAFAILFAVLMTYWFVKWMSRPSVRNLLLYGVFLFAGLVSNLSAGFVAVAHFGYLMLAPGRKRMLGRWIVAVFIVLLVFSPWAREIVLRAHPERVVGGETGEPLRGGAALNAMVIPYSFFTYSVGYSLGPSVRDIKAGGMESVKQNLHWVLAAAVLFAIPILAGLRKLLQMNPSLLFLLALWLFVPICVVILLVTRNIKVFTPRYALVALPAYAMIVGQGLSVISRSRFWVVTIVFTALLSISISNYFNAPAYGKDGFREAARVIESHFGDGDTVLGIYTTEPLVHYLSGTAEVSVFAAKDVISREAMVARCQAVAGGAERVWLSLCRESLIDPEGYVHTWFDSNLNLVRYFSFPGIRLYLYEKRSE